MASIANSIYKAAEFYTGAVETGAGIAYYGADATISCLDGMFSTTAAGWTLGLKNSLKECAKWSLGFNDCEKAAEAFRIKPPVLVPNGKGLQTVDKRPFSQRLGEATGHLINGGCKAVTTGALGLGTTAYAVGNISNAMTWEAAYKFGDFHRASRSLATGVNEVAKFMLGFGLEAAKFGLKGAQFAASGIINNPDIAFNTVGMGTALYFASHQVVQAGKSDSYIRKTAHCSLAALSLGAMALVPAMNPFKK